MQGRQPPDQATQSHIQPGLECLQGWGIHNHRGPKVSQITYKETDSHIYQNQKVPEHN